MEKFRLISMTDFVLEQEQKKKNGNSVFKETIFQYANFLKQLLKLEMFIPCDKDGNILEEPTMEKYGWYFANHQEEQSGWMYEEGESEYNKAISKYKKTKEKVLFENVEKYRFTSLSGERVIQFGTRVNFIFKPIIETRNGIVKVFVNDINSLTDYNLELTPNATKQFL